jgi:hypothetical protein
MVVLAFLTDPAVVAKILGHLGLPTTAPALAPANLLGRQGEVCPSGPGSARSPVMTGEFRSWRWIQAAWDLASRGPGTDSGWVRRDLVAR